MILLDTNAIYYSIGLSSPNEDSNLNISLLVQEINNSCHFTCSSLTVYEILNHYRNNSKTVRQIFSFLKSNQIGLIQNPYLPIRYSISELSEIKQNELELFLETEFSLKTEVETRYTLALLSCIFSFNLLTYLKDKANIQADEIGMNALIIANEMVANVGYEILFNAFDFGYKNQNCENEVRQQFNGLLECFTQLLCPLVSESIIHGLDLSQENVSLMQKKLRKKIQKQATSVKYTQKQAKAMTQSCEYKKLFDEITKNALNNFVSFKIKPSMQNFLQGKYLQMINDGESFRKNDIVDKMLLDDLQPTDMIYTFDRNLRKFIMQNQADYTAYLNSILELKKFGTLKNENI